jgi:sugar phosphate isomerase/epimerase
MAEAPLSRLSLNQYTTQRWSVAEAVDGCAQAGLAWIGLWRDKVAEQGLEESAKLVREAGLRVSSLCRGGMFPADSEAERQKRIADNVRAIDEAATLGTDTLVLVCGGLHSKDIAGARQMVYDGIAALIPYARANGVRLGIEPLHPMYAADRNVIASLKQANDFAFALNAEAGGTTVGVVIDVFHVWWDPVVYAEIVRASAHTLGFHICDWITPLPDVLKGRGMMGDGWIELHKLYHAVQEAGYSGPIECEIFNQALWDTPGDEVVALMKARYLEHVISHEQARSQE